MHNQLKEYGLTPENTIDYLRKSQSDDPALTVEEVLEKHEQMLDDWAVEYLGGKVPEENKFREVVSGETLKGRPEINKVLRMIESPKYKAIAVVDPQRLTRGDLEDIGRLMKLLKHTNTIVCTPRDFYDLRKERDFDAFERELKRGNDYLEYTKKILSRGREMSVERGHFIGSIAPYGYEKIMFREGNRKCHTLKIIPEQAAVVRMIFDMYVNKDMGRPSICYKLDAMGIKAPRGAHWSKEARKDLLENIHYIGKVRWNWRKTVTIVEDGEVINTRPKSDIGEYLVYEGKHEAIIPEELFYAALEKSKRNHKAKGKTPVANPLAGLLFCSCGRALSLKFFKDKEGKERSAPRLTCEGQKYCNSGSALYSEIEERIIATLEECIEDFKVRVKNDTGDSVKLHNQLIKRLENQKKLLEEKELAQWEAQSDPDPSIRMPPHIFKLLNEKLLKEKEEVQDALCKAYESMPEPVDYEEKIVRFSEALEALRDTNRDAKEKNKLLKACIERVTYTRERPVRLKSQQETYYDPDQKKTRYRSTLGRGGSWSSPPIDLDIKLRL